MRVAKWGNSLAIRLPSIVVEALELKEGDDVEIRAVGRGELHVAKKPDREELIARLRKYRGLLPADFKFDREEANER
jgi:antitoxin MazE